MEDGVIYAKITREKSKDGHRTRSYIELYPAQDFMAYNAIPSVKFYKDGTDIKIRVRNRRGIPKDTLARDFRFVKEALEFAEEICERY